jgi:hypothetical protein
MSLCSSNPHDVDSIYSQKGCNLCTHWMEVTMDPIDQDHRITTLCHMAEAAFYIL